MSQPALLAVRNLTVRFNTRRGWVTAVDNVSLDLRPGETLGVVGESGAGKSTLALALMRLIDPPGEISAGHLEFEGRDLIALSAKEMEHIRGNRIAIIFQDPVATLNPVYRVGDQIAEALILHRGVSKQEAWARAVKALSEVGMSSPEIRAKSYPHQLSGGMQQRAVIAAAIALEPALIIADEPTAALDATIQAQILDLMQELIVRHASSLVLVAHNLAVVAQVADTIAVMYAGRLVEMGRTSEVLDHPKHPYTLGLIECIPSVNKVLPRLKQIPGIMPDLESLPSGCAFRVRCDFCREPDCLEAPLLRETSPDRWVACHFPLTER
jgi:peptide/nickel transport system ATP-binding protein